MKNHLELISFVIATINLAISCKVQVKTKRRISLTNDDLVSEEGQQSQHVLQ